MLNLSYRTNLLGRTLLEIREVAETTRPARADALKAFEQFLLDPLQKTMEEKNFETFETAFRQPENAKKGRGSWSRGAWPSRSAMWRPPAPEGNPSEEPV